MAGRRNTIRDIRMTYTYTYQVVSVNADARCMEVRFETPGKPPVNVGVRLPSPGENLGDVINAYAPTAYWDELARPVVLPEVGATGSIAPAEKVSATPASDVVFEQVPLVEI